MKTKLTLTVEESVILKAKNYARAKNRSLSNLVENYRKALDNENVVKESEATSIVNSLKGSFKMPKEFDYKSELSKRIQEKYL